MTNIPPERRRGSSNERESVDFNRNYIERRDFPATRRGYDPDAVDRHLREVADTVEELQDLMGELQRAPRSEPVSLSGAAADRVRLIIEAAEASAAEIEESSRREAAAAEKQARQVVRTAESTASDVEMRAQQLAATIGEQADEVIEGRIAQVEESSDDLLRRADALEGELASLAETHRLAGDLLAQLVAQATPLRGEIESMRGALEGLRGAGTATEAETLEATDSGEHDRRLEETQAFAVGDADPDPLDGHEPLEAELEADGDLERAGDARGPAGLGAHEIEDAEWEDDAVGAPGPPEPRGAEEEIAPAATPDGELPPEALEPSDPGVPEDEEEGPAGRSAASAGGGGDEGARLVALNMALNGTPREETDRYLAENFDLADRRALLDDVYARVG